MTMDLMDLANAGFEGFGALFILNHARVLLKQKLVRGVSVLSTGFFFSWGVFNIFYYSHLGQTYSWLAGILMTCANLTYIGLMIYFKNKEKHGTFL